MLSTIPQQRHRHGKEQVINLTDLIKHDPELRKIFHRPSKQQCLLKFMTWAWHRRLLQVNHRLEGVFKSLTETDALKWLDKVKDNNSGLILIRTYQQSVWPDLMRLIVRLLELQLLVVPEGRSGQ